MRSKLTDAKEGWPANGINSKDPLQIFDKKRRKEDKQGTGETPAVLVALDGSGGEAAT